MFVENCVAFGMAEHLMLVEISPN